MYRYYSCRISIRLIIQKELRIIAAVVNRPAVPQVTTLSQLTVPLGKQSTACGKEENLITVHVLTAHPVLISILKFRRKTNTQNNLST